MNSKPPVPLYAAGWTGFLGRYSRCLVSAAGCTIGVSALGQNSFTASYDFFVLAGSSGSTGSADGTGASAQFYFPSRLVLDGSGNAYVADTYNDTIREITPAGVVTTLAGSPGVQGSSDGTGSAARFYQPLGIAIDDLGDLFVADTYNNTIRKMTPTTANGVTSWAVTTVAGAAGVSGDKDGTGAAALFYNPTGVAVDRLGNVYVSEVDATIRRIAPGGVVTTLAGTPMALGSQDGVGSAAQFATPADLAVDNSGNIFVADASANTIRKIVPTVSAGVTTWTVSTLAGTAPTSISIVGILSGPGQGVSGEGFVDGTGGAAEFDGPRGISVDASGNVYVADTFNGAIRRVTPGGVVSTVADVSGAKAAGFSSPTGIALDGAGNIYVGDSLDGTIREGFLASEPVIAGQPVSETVNSGSTAVFNVTGQFAAGTTYQWQLNGVNLSDGGTIAGSAGPQLVISGATSANNGAYTCIVTIGSLSVHSDPATLTVTSAANPGFLVNLSARASVGVGNDILIGGFFVGGTTSRTVLIQALGPALASQGVSGPLQQPILTLHDSTGAVIYSNTGWGSNPVLQKAAASVYANPPLQPNSADSELLVTLPPGGYTAEVAGVGNGTGIALCAIYELP